MKSERLGAVSDTSAMSAMFEQVQAPIEGYVDAFPSDSRQVGAVFFVNGRLVGLELFDAPATWRKLAPKLLRSVALDALDCRDAPARSPLSEEAARFVAALAGSDAAIFPAVGEGEDVRLSNPALTGAALVAMGRAIHVSAFAEVNG